MKYRSECFDLGFICETVFEGENRGEVLDEVLAHLDASHGTGAGSSGFKEFLGRHIGQIADEPSSDSSSTEPGHRRRRRGTAHVTTWFADRIGKRRSHHNDDEEPTP